MNYADALENRRRTLTYIVDQIVEKLKRLPVSTIGSYPGRPELRTGPKPGLVYTWGFQPYDASWKEVNNVLDAVTYMCLGNDQSKIFDLAALEAKVFSANQMLNLIDTTPKLAPVSIDTSERNINYVESETGREKARLLHAASGSDQSPD